MVQALGIGLVVDDGRVGGEPDVDVVLEAVGYAQNHFVRLQDSLRKSVNL